MKKTLLNFIGGDFGEKVDTSCEGCGMHLTKSHTAVKVIMQIEEQIRRIEVCFLNEYLNHQSFIDYYLILLFSCV